MPEIGKKVYWDACTFLSFIEGTPDRADDVRAVFEEAINKEIVLYTSAISITEVAFVAAERRGDLDEKVEHAIDRLWQAASSVRVVEYTPLVAYEARRLLRLKLERRIPLKPLDAIHIATAVRMKVDVLHTYDGNMKKWAGPTGMKIIAPKPFQMLLMDNDAKGETDKPKQPRP